jgi:hypothetical protein
MLLLSLPRYTSTHPKSHAHKDHVFVLAYASRHGYMDIADIAAPLTIGLAPAVVVALLSPVAVLPYVGLPFTFLVWGVKN